jgi:hypothetical protein
MPPMEPKAELGVASPLVLRSSGAPPRLRPSAAADVQRGERRRRHDQDQDGHLHPQRDGSAVHDQTSVSSSPGSLVSEVTARPSLARGRRHRPSGVRLRRGGVRVAAPVERGSRKVPRRGRSAVVRPQPVAIVEVVALEAFPPPDIDRDVLRRCSTTVIRAMERSIPAGSLDQARVRKGQLIMGRRWPPKSDVGCGAPRGKGSGTAACPAGPQ